MEEEQLRNFNDRLNQWISAQGFWFMLRYSLSGTGMRGQILYHLLGLIFRVFIFTVLVGVGILVFLFVRTRSDKFSFELSEKIQTRLHASELQRQGISGERGKLSIAMLGAEGETDTFYSMFEVRGIRCDMGIIDGLMGKWNPGVISMSSLDVNLRAGYDNEEQSEAAGKVFFAKSDKVEIGTLEVAHTEIRWGFSSRTMGEISNSRLTAQRLADGWKFIFSGGTFTQNWLKNLEIDELVVVCKPEAIVFEKAVCKKNGGTVDFSGLKVIPGPQPVIEGIVKLNGYTIESIIPDEMEDYIAGTFSGNLEVGGSTNQNSGVSFRGKLELGKKDTITVRSRLPLLRALSDLDGQRNYNRLDFQDGSLTMSTNAGELRVSDVDLISEDGIELRGGFVARKPNAQEKSQILLQSGGSVDDAMFYEDDLSLESLEALASRSDMSLKKAARLTKAANDTKKDGAEDEMESDANSITMKREKALRIRTLRMELADRLASRLWYDGQMVLFLPGDTFKNSGALEYLYTPNKDTGKIDLQVPIRGLFFELTLAQEQALYQQAQSR